MDEDQIVERLSRESRRATADTVLALSDRAWLRGWLIGFFTGVAVVIAIYSLVHWYQGS